MNYFLPFILTFLLSSSYSLQLSIYGFIHKDITQIFKLSKMELGYVYMVSAVGTTIGTILMFLTSRKLKQKTVSYYTYGASASVFFYLMIVLTVLIFQHPPKLILFVLLFFIGMLRAIYFPCNIIIIKNHQQISGHVQIKSSFDRLLKSIWSVNFDAGLVLGFFFSNWLNYSVGWRWQYLVILGSVIHLFAALLLLFVLQPYIQNQHIDQIKQVQENKIQNKIQPNPVKLIHLSMLKLLKLISSNRHSKLFLINVTILQAMHLNICFVLPPFFYSIGFKGSQGYLLAIYSISIIVGSSILGFIDFAIQNIIELFNLKKNAKHQQNQQIVSFKKPQNDQSKQFKRNYQNQIFLILSTIFLLLFFIIQVLMSLDILKYRKNQSTSNSKERLWQSTIKICLLGFFFGGPLKSYLSTRILSTTEQLQNLYLKQSHLQIKNGGLYDEENHRQFIESQTSCLPKFQIAGGFVTFSRISVHLATILFYLIAFFLIQKYIAYLFVFLSFMGFLGVIFDIIQDIHIYQMRKTQNLKIYEPVLEMQVQQ